MPLVGAWCVRLMRGARRSAFEQAERRMSCTAARLLARLLARLRRALRALLPRTSCLPAPLLALTFMTQHADGTLRVVPLAQADADAGALSGAGECGQRSGTPT